MLDQTSASMTARANDSPHAARPGECNGGKHLRLDGERHGHDGRRHRAASTRSGPGRATTGSAPRTASATDASTREHEHVGDGRRDDPEGDRSARELDLARLAQAPRDHDDLSGPDDGTGDESGARGCARGMRERAWRRGCNGYGRRWPARSAARARRGRAPARGRCSQPAGSTGVTSERNPDRPLRRPGNPSRRSGPDRRAVRAAASRRSPTASARNPRWCQCRRTRRASSRDVP